MWRPCPYDLESSTICHFIIYTSEKATLIKTEEKNPFESDHNYISRLLLSFCFIHNLRTDAVTARAAQR
jgi:hypothetical protein